ncbi:MAG TPA: hypothetical protein VGC56_00665 [Allosphingosinicella sp.]
MGVVRRARFRGAVPCDFERVRGTDIQFTVSIRKLDPEFVPSAEKTIIENRPQPNRRHLPFGFVSPFVQPGSIYSADLDHTSFLAFLAERFTPGHGYSVGVNDRQGHLTGRISAALSATARSDLLPPMPPIAAPVAATAAAAGTAPSAPDTPNAVAFDKIARRLKKERPDLYGHEDMSDVRAYLLQAFRPTPDVEGHIPARNP